VGALDHNNGFLAALEAVVAQEEGIRAAGTNVISQNETVMFCYFEYILGGLVEERVCASH
jgi:hypothetical protein